MSEYVHQTYNHLMFDRIRELQLDVELIKSYLIREETSRVGGADLADIIFALDRISSDVFELVYKPLREKWA